MTREERCPYVPTEAVGQSPPTTIEITDHALVDVGAETEKLFDWYINGGFRGCLFNKVAARDAKREQFPWHVEVVEGDINQLTATDTGESLIQSFRKVVEASTDDAALASFIFPELSRAEDYASLLKFLASRAPDIFRIFPIQDKGLLGVGVDVCEFVGIQFRISLGRTDAGEEIFSYPMIYTPDDFTTFARRYDRFMIVFNPRTTKHNPETPETYIGVDDIDLGLSTGLFSKLLARSLQVNKDAHSLDGIFSGNEESYSRELFRAHNALVLPATAWEAGDV